jgi:hypothetical protein
MVCSNTNPVYWNYTTLKITPVSTSSVLTGGYFTYASTTCSDATTSVIINTSSSVGAINGFSYGEITNGFFLLLSLIVLSVVAFHLHFGRIKIKN